MVKPPLVANPVRVTDAAIFASVVVTLTVTLVGSVSISANAQFTVKVVSSRIVLLVRASPASEGRSLTGRMTRLNLDVLVVLPSVTERLMVLVAGPGSIPAGMSGAGRMRI